MSMDQDQRPLPMGSLEDLLELLAPFNTAPDRPIQRQALEANLGSAFLHGPGLVVEIPAASAPIVQVLITVDDDEWAWPVLMRIRRATGWSFLDPNTGQRM